MKRLVLPLIALLASPGLAVAAWEGSGSSSAPALEALSGAAGPSAVFRAEVSQPSAPAPAPMLVTYDGADAFAYKPGKDEFIYAGYRYSLKVLFGKGVYDSYSRTFKASPYLTLDISDGGRWPLFPLEGLKTADFDVTDENDYGCLLRVSRDRSYLRVSGRGEGPSFSDVASLRVSSLYEDWAANARPQALKVGEKTVYLVSQATMEEETRNWRYGYVVSVGAVVQPSTGLPQDFVELFRNTSDGVNNYRPKAYSLALGIVFELQDASYQLWSVRPMRDEEVEDAMNEALANR